MELSSANVEPAFLVIDDDEDDFVLIKTMLREVFSPLACVEWVTNSADATRKFSEKNYDICLVDYRLGEETGLDVIRKSVEAGIRLPFILLTGLESREKDLEAMAAGASDFLVKDQLRGPVLERSIRYVLNHQRHLVAETKAKEDLDKKNRRLSELYRTAHKFVDNVSHEFRTPLTVIKEYASILQDGLAGDVNPGQFEHLGTIIRRVNDLAIMIDDMLDTSKLQTGLMGILRQECTAQDIVSRIRTTIESRAVASEVRLEFAIAPDLPGAYCDPEKVGRVLVNLVTNAIKFSGEGTKVTVSAVHDAETSDIVFSVADQGPGISPADLSAIFGRFNQIDAGARSATKGFGLGLSIAKELSNLNLGDLSVESEVGKGSVFTVSIPTLDAPKLLDRYLERVRYFRDDVSWVALAKASVEPDEDAAILEDTLRFLQLHLRGSDLVFRCAKNTWLMVLASSEEDPAAVFARLENARKDANGNRPDKDLPEITFEFLCGAPVLGSTAAIIEVFEAELDASRSAYLPSAPSSAFETAAQ